MVPPIAMPSESVRMISNLSTCWSGSSRYSVPASALVMRLAATRMVSSRRLMSRSLESAMPMAFSSSSRCSRLSPVRHDMLLSSHRNDPDYLIQTARTWCMSVTPLSTFSIPSCFRVRIPSSSAVANSSATRACSWMSFLHRIGADQQLVQADTAAVAGARAFVATHFFVQGDLAFVVAEQLDPLGIQRLEGGIRVLLPGLGVAQFLGIFGQQRFDLILRGDMRLSCSPCTGAWPDAAPGCRAGRRRS